MFRVFVTNAALLQLLRPQTFTLLRAKFKPVSNRDWRVELGADVPARIITALQNKAPGTKAQGFVLTTKTKATR